MSDSVSKIAERIRRLLALTASSNVHEAAAAAAEAQRLMQAHKLSAADVEAEDGNKISELPLGSQGYMAPWKFSLVTNVARAFFCEVIALRLRSRRKIRVIGRKNDAEVAIGVFNYLVKEIDRLADEDAEHYMARSMIESGAIDIRTYKEKFREGAAMGVTNRLKQETAAFTTSSETALAVVNKSKDELRDYLKSKYGASKTVEQKKPDSIAAEEAFLRGYDRGANIAVPRANGTEKYLTGKVETPPPADAQVHTDWYDDELASDLADIFDMNDLSRGRGGRGFGE